MCLRRPKGAINYTPIDRFIDQLLYLRGRIYPAYAKSRSLKCREGLAQRKYRLGMHGGLWPTRAEVLKILVQMGMVRCA